MSLSHASQKAIAGQTRIRFTFQGRSFILNPGEELWARLSSPTHPTRTTSVLLWPGGPTTSATLVDREAGPNAGA